MASREPGRTRRPVRNYSRNHYVPKWFQHRSFHPRPRNRSSHCLDLKPDTRVSEGGTRYTKQPAVPRSAGRVPGRRPLRDSSRNLAEYRDRAAFLRSHRQRREAGSRLLPRLPAPKRKQRPPARHALVRRIPTAPSEIKARILARSGSDDLASTLHAVWDLGVVVLPLRRSGTCHSDRRRKRSS